MVFRVSKNRKDTGMTLAEPIWDEDKGTNIVPPPPELQPILDQLLRFRLDLTPEQEANLNKRDPELARYAKQAEIYMGRITPKMATIIYHTRNNRNRGIKDGHLKQLVQAAKEGELMLTNNGLGFDVNWDFVDGQHRLRMLMESGKSGIFFIIKGVDPQARDVTDSTAPRRLRDDLQMEKLRNAGHLSSVMTYIQRYDDGNMKSTGGWIKPSRHKAKKQAIIIEEDLQHSVQMGARVYRAIGGSLPSYAFCHYVCSQVDTTGENVDALELADQFFTNLADGVGLQKGDPAYELREKLRNNFSAPRKSARYDERYDYMKQAAITIKAWNFMRKGERASSRKLEWYPWGKWNQPFPRAI